MNREQQSPGNTQLAARAIRGSVCFTAAILLMACKPHGDTRSQHLLDRSEAVKISRVAALAKGYDLERYQLRTSGQELSQDKKDWVFGYALSPGPPPPGGFFLVVVDRRTGKAEVYPGE